jgi:phage pi2 protein 07
MSESLTIAQALRKVKKLKGLIAEHKARAITGVSYVSDVIPAFRYAEEVAAMDLAVAEMLDLQARIATANATTIVEDVLVNGRVVNLAHAVRLLEEAKSKIDFLQKLVLRTETISTRDYVYDQTSEKNVIVTKVVQFVSDLSEKERDSQVKKMQDLFEQINNSVEDLNHKVLV